jgi:DUF1680 family protein
VSGTRPLGELADRLDRAARRLLLDDVYRPEWITSDITFDYDPAPWNDWYQGHEWTWYADVSGRYLNALVSYAGATGTALEDKAKRVAEVVFSRQSADGHFGTDRPLDACDRSQASGTAWMLLALPRYYELTGDERALEAARRLARWYAAVTPFWLRREVIEARTMLGSYALIYSNFTHCLDGLAALWRVDRRDGYVELARRIAAAVKSCDEEIHSHHYLSTLRGMLDWQAITGDAALLEKARGGRDAVAAGGMLDTGGVPESFTSWASDEGCSEVDWVLVNLKLHAATGRADYLECAERALHGHLYLSQCPNGGFGHWRGFHEALGPQGPGAAGRFAEAYWCCSMHGVYGLAEVARYAVSARGSRVGVNLFVGVDAEVALPQGKTARVRQSCLEYPFPGSVEIDVELPGGAEMELAVHLPAHTPLAEARLDGQPLPASSPPELLLPLARPGWHRLVLRFSPSVRAESCLRPDLFGEKRSLWYGPMPLGTNAPLAHARYSLAPEVVSAMRPRPSARPGSFPSEMEVDLPASDAPDFARTRDRSRIVLYPLAGHGYRHFSSLAYLF